MEASDRVGGWMKTRTIKQDGGEGLEVAIEEGPRSVRPKGGLGAARMLGLVSRISAHSLDCRCDGRRSPTVGRRTKKR